MEFIFEDTEPNTPNSTNVKRRPYSSSNRFSQSATGSSAGSTWTPPAEANNPLARRKNVPVSATDVEIAPNPRRKRKSANVNYLNSAKTPKKRKQSKESFVWTWNKIGWLICFGVFLRLIFMDRGVAHYYQMQDTLKDKKRELAMVKEENVELISELHQIKVSPLYQKKIAREHLGVIAQDEYLILFATDGRPRSI